LEKTNRFIKSNLSGIVSWVIFFATLAVVLLTLASVIFPALILGFPSDDKYPIEINQLETGIWAYPLLITSLLVFVTEILY